MINQNIIRMLDIISRELNERQIPYSLIGALALGSYGFPRFTADVDIMTENTYSNIISDLMKNLGYTCFQKTKLFAQFDSEKGDLGKVDFMFVSTDEGKNIIKRSAFIVDELIGSNPVVQPVDYIGLKLMAIANNATRSPKDVVDIFQCLQLVKNGLLPSNFELPDRDRIYYYADRFGLRERIDDIFRKLNEKANPPEGFEL
jgi:hypothetical protein